MKNRAKAFATKAHEGQFRKNSQEPYITHPIRVAEILEQAGFGEELICAGLLHDVVEDTPFTINDIEKEFNSVIASLVASHTEDKSKSWDERKRHTIETVKNGKKEIKYLIVADKLDNLRSIEQALHKQGEQIWNQFNAGYEKQKWYNESIAQHMKVGLHILEIPGYFLDYEQTVMRVFNK